MMGERQVAQEALFYEFNLERHVPPDHWVRAIDRFVDLSEISMWSHCPKAAGNIFEGTHALRDSEPCRPIFLLNQIHRPAESRDKEHLVTDI
jgi:hypothetical protein